MRCIRHGMTVNDDEDDAPEKQANFAGNEEASDVALAMIKVDNPAVAAPDSKESGIESIDRFL